MKKNNNNAIIITSIISVVILIVAALLIFSFSPQSKSISDTVTVEGVGSVKVIPDVLSIKLKVETLKKTSVEAKDENAKIMEKVINALIANGFTREELVTDNFNIYEQFDWNSGNRKSIGFRATHGVSMKFGANENEKLSTVIDTAVENGATIDYINFALSTEIENKYKAEAMKVAALDAKVKAQSVAEGFNKKLGKLINIKVNNFGYNPWIVYGEVADTAVMESVATNVEVGEKEVTARVGATYKFR